MLNHFSEEQLMKITQLNLIDQQMIESSNQLQKDVECICLKLGGDWSWIKLLRD